MNDWYYNYMLMIMSILCVILFGLGYVIGEDRGVDNFVNKVCQKTQYEFCQPTYKYKAKGGNNDDR